MTRMRLIFTMGNLVAILVLAILAAVVYHRVAIDYFSPPVYAIRVRPAETWHHVEFVISPSYGFQMTIDGGSGNAGSPDAKRRQ